MIRIGSLFSGIGGIEQALEASIPSAKTVWQAECDPQCLTALEAHWPQAKRYTDVRQIDESAERVDIICGGFPCTGFSSAGKRRGFSDERSGLWSEYVRIVRVLRPNAVFVENVSRLLNCGIDRVLGDLADLGFHAEWNVFSSASVGAGHRRRRLYLLAYTNGFNGEEWLGRREGRQEPLSPRSQDEVQSIRLASRCPIPSMDDGLPRKLARLPGNSVDVRVAQKAWEALANRAATFAT